MQENDNNNENTLNIECIYCQKITELDSDSLFAIKDRME